jgi:hypothetical protein
LAELLAEHIIGSIRRECLNHVIVINQWHVRQILKSYLGYYHHFFSLGWHMLRSLFMSQEALERGIAEMRQIAELKAEAALADGEDKGGQADPERYLSAIVFASI